MKKARKRGLAWLMTLAMMVSLLPMTAWANALPIGPGGTDEEPLFYMRVALYEDAELENQIYDHDYSDVEEPVYATNLPIELNVDEYREELGSIEHDGVTYEIAGFTRDYENIETSLYIPAPSGEDWWATWADGIQIVYLPAGTSISGGSSDKTDYYNITATIEAFDAEGNALGYLPLGKVSVVATRTVESANGLSDDTVAKALNVREDTEVDLSIDIYEGKHDYEFKGWALKENAAADAELDGETEKNFKLNRNMDMVAVFVEKAPKEESGYVIHKEFDYGELKVIGGDFVYIEDHDGNEDVIVLFEDGDYTVTMNDGVEVAKEETLVVFNGTDADITLDHVHITSCELYPKDYWDVKDYYSIGIDGEDNTNSVNLILKGENILEGRIYTETEKDRRIGILLDNEEPGSLVMEEPAPVFRAVNRTIGKLMHDDIVVWAGATEEEAREDGVYASGAYRKFDMGFPYIYIAGADSFEYFDFNNSADKFFNTGETQDYSSGELFEWFEKRMKENGISMGKLNALKMAEGEEWGGSCFGFSAVAAMFHEEEMSLNELNLFDEDAEDLPTTTEPKDDTDVRDLLNYYQTLQMLPEVRGTMRYLSKADDQKYLLQLAERLARATDAGIDDPVMFLYFMGNGAGHAVIVDGAVRNEDGSYTVMVEDNRFYGQELATDVEFRNGKISGYKLTGQDINPTLEISKDGKKAVMTFEGGWTTRDENTFSKYPEFTEKLTRYEVITNYEMLKDYFPGEYKAPEAGVDEFIIYVDENPVFWFEAYPIDDGGEEDTEEPPVVIVDPGREWQAISLKDETEEGRDGGFYWERYGRNFWNFERRNIIPSAVVSVDEDLNVVMEYEPATMMATLEENSDTYMAVNPDGDVTGKIAYAEGDIYSSIDTEKADAGVFDAVDGNVAIIGNEGKFEITVTRNGGEELTKVSGETDGDISAVPTADGIVVIAPAGTYHVTFIDKDGKETEKSFTTAGGQVSVGTDGAVEVPEVVPVSELPFADVKATDWFYNAVKYVYENGLMSGTSETTFSPAVTTSRGMITSILWRMEGRPDATADVPFTDVAKDAYYAEAIAWAAENGIVSGYGDTFGPNDPITREQLASILFRYANYKGYDVSVGENTNILSYNDAFEISEYAIPAMQWACGEGIISGNDDGTLNPAGHAQRSHAAQMLMKFDENVK